MLEITDIFDLLPHRYPFLLVDRVEEIDKFKFIRCYKNITFNEPQFTGHFPDKPIFPGVMIIEAMAQATGILAFYSKNYTPDSSSLYLLVGVDNVRFKNMIVPGDKMTLTAEVVKSKKDIWKFNCQALVDNKAIASATLICAEKKAN